MSTNQVSKGKTLDYTNSGADIAVNSVVIVGSLVGVAAVDIATGETGTLDIEGVFNLPKVDGADITQGDTVNYDVSVSKFDDNAAVAAAGDITGSCIAMESKGATTGENIAVKINVGAGTIT